MSCSVPHVIELSNLTNDITVPHELLLIKGKIRKICSQKQIHLKTINGKILQTTLISLNNGEFKILYNFQEETKDFCISYCCESINFKCTYKPPKNPYKIQPLYIICKGHDGSFNASKTQNGSPVEACAIIDLNMKLLQCLYAEKLNECGFGRKTFTLKSGCEIFESNLNVSEVWDMSQEELWDKFAYEVINSEHGHDNHVKFVAFISCTKYESITDGDFSYDNIKRHMRGNAALGGGGLALFGSGFFYSWPSKFEDIYKCLENNIKVDLERYADDSNYRRTYCGVFATSLGAVCHEMGHIFDLGHTTEGVMGTGFDYLNRVFNIDKLTESLPNRIIGEVQQPGPVRFTKINRDQNRFLEKYHEQKSGNDSFYFTKNCAIILAYHRWLRIDESDESDAKIEINKETLKVSASCPIKLIEIRCSLDSLVVDYFEFTEEISAYEFIIDKKWKSNKYYIFIICVNGTINRLDFDE